MPKWPELRDWPLDQLVRLRASWHEVTPQTPAEHEAHQSSMTELNEYIALASSHP